MDLTDLHALSASDGGAPDPGGRDQLRRAGRGVPCADREVDPDVQAWAFLDPDLRAGAGARRRRVAAPRAGPLGPLHGVPVGVKDIIDTADMPTENGSVLHAGRQPARDATVVAMLRAAGAVIMGKTVTTEFAAYAPGQDAQPPQLRRTRRAARPAGRPPRSPRAWCRSRSAARPMAPSIRPAAFCGVYGFKPTHGLIPRHGVLPLSRTLDHVGLFARTSDDIALLAEQLVGYDERDPDTRPRARIPYREVAAEEPPLAPMFAFVKTSRWDRADGRDARGLRRARRAPRRPRGGGRAGPRRARTFAWHRLIMEAEMAREPRAGMGPRARAPVGVASGPARARPRGHTALEYQRALRRRPPFAESLADLFEQRYDAIITPAAPGTAPAGLEATGDPASARCGRSSACRR